MMALKNRFKPAFTIVELLVVIVVIGILAAITIVSYTGISQKATITAIKSDLTNNTNRLNMYYVDHGSYPTSIDPTTKCPLDSSSVADTSYCLKVSPGNTIDNYSSTGPNYQLFTLDVKNTASSVTYRITKDTAPTIVSGPPTVVIGTQTWMQSNLDVGTRIDGATAQTNNATLEKWCYNDDTANCTTYGGLYSWNEMMQYTTTAGAQGICPTGFHIPTDAEFQTMEVFLGMTSGQANSTGFRGSDQGTKLKTGGTSGFNFLVGGANPGGYYDIGTYGYIWTSSQYDASDSWSRDVRVSGETGVERQGNYIDNSFGFSARCIMN